MHPLITEKPRWWHLMGFALWDIGLGITLIAQYVFLNDLFTYYMQHYAYNYNHLVFMASIASQILGIAGYGIVAMAGWIVLEGLLSIYAKVRKLFKGRPSGIADPSRIVPLNPFRSIKEVTIKMPKFPKREE